MHKCNPRCVLTEQVHFDVGYLAEDVSEEEAFKLFIFPLRKNHMLLAGCKKLLEWDKNIAANRVQQERGILNDGSKGVMMEEPRSAFGITFIDLHGLLRFEEEE